MIVELMLLATVVIGILGVFLSTRRRAQQDFFWTSVLSLSALCFLTLGAYAAICVFSICVALGMLVDVLVIKEQKRI